MRIAVLGYAGSGKTYISNYISKKKSVPVLNLDSIKYDKEWKPIDNSFVLPQVVEFMSKDDWIIDGFGTHLLMDERLEKADMIILMLLPRFTCLIQTVKRKKLRNREGYKKDLNWWFVNFTLFGCRSKERQRIYTEIEEKYKDKTVVLKTKQQVNSFIESIK